jgi:hypothetical protein
VNSRRGSKSLSPNLAPNGTAAKDETQPWLFFGSLSFIFAKWIGDRDHPWGLLPFAEGEVRGVTATYDRGVGVILRGVHPRFVEETRSAQGR